MMNESYPIYPGINPPPIVSEYDITVKHVSKIVFYGCSSENLIRNELSDIHIGVNAYIDKWLATSNEDNIYYPVVVENFQMALNGYIKHFKFYNVQNNCYIDLMHDVLLTLRHMIIRNHYTYYQCEKTLHKLRDSMMSAISTNWICTEFEM